MAIFTFIEGWYNLKRRHSAFDYYAQMAYEKMCRKQAAAVSV